jgi:hypothetical protein
MKRLLITGAALTLLAVPTTAQAKPGETDRSNAAQECRAERGDSAAAREAFAARYGTNANKRNAFGKCVSQRSRSEERQREETKEEAVEECKTERTELGSEAFAAKYGTNANQRNAYGKCVSQQAGENKAERDEADAEKIKARKSVARDCRAERTEMGRDAFAQKYGTNANKRNAFGKCVSQGARS